MGVERTMHKITMMLLGIPVARLTQKAVAVLWRQLRPSDPQTDPKHPHAKWPDAVAFAALTAAAAAGATVLTRRAADTAFRAAIGMEPPAPKPSKAKSSKAKPSKGQSKQDQPKWD